MNGEDSSVETPQEWIDIYQHRMIADICDLIRIPSVSKETNDPAAPFGEECLRGLEYCLKIGERMGFISENHENYCGSLVWPGERKTEIGVFGHVDVVPAGAGWTHRPFEPMVKDGLIIGRGAWDNKGSFASALYAVYYLKDQGHRFKNTIRFFIGCNEESGMKDVEYYATNYHQPVFSIVPDADFPVCNGEKGILKIHAIRRMHSNVLLGFSAGIADNAVPDQAEAVLRIDEAEASGLTSLGCQVTRREDGCYRVATRGVAAHAAFPEGSQNAEVELARILLSSGVLDREGDALMQTICILFGDYYGAGLGVPWEDEVSGKLTHIGGMASYEAGAFCQSIDIRYNVTADHERLMKSITNVLGWYGFTIQEAHHSPPFFLNRDDPIVRTLVDVCNRHWEKKLEPYIMGGATYARKLKRAVAFGPTPPLPQRRSGSGQGLPHQPDEYIEIDVLKKAFIIYVDALKALDDLL